MIQDLKFNSNKVSETWNKHPYCCSDKTRLGFFRILKYNQFISEAKRGSVVFYKNKKRICRKKQQS